MQPGEFDRQCAARLATGEYVVVWDLLCPYHPEADRYPEQERYVVAYEARATEQGGMVVRANVKVERMDATTLASELAGQVKVPLERDESPDKGD